MNITRGAFRLWVVIAVMWMAGSLPAAWHYWNVPRPVTDPAILAQLNDGKPNDWVTPKTGVELTDEQVGLGVPKPAFNLTKPFEVIPDTDQRWTALAITLGPPSALLALWLALLWVYRGFRPSPPGIRH